MLKMACVVCHIETRKYKCPNCTEYYCSLDCFKKHKETKCEPKPTMVEESTSNNPKIPILFQTEDTVNREKLEALRHSEGLKNLLYNPHLRALLKELDEAPKARQAIKAAMQEPLFIEFADECLKVVEPVDNDDDN